MGLYSESASKNMSDPILKIRKERFLIFPLACDLVLAHRFARAAPAPRAKRNDDSKNRGRASPVKMTNDGAVLVGSKLSAYFYTTNNAN